MRFPHAIFLLMAAGCTAGTQPTTMRADSAGVELVRNTGVDRALGWTLTPERTLGSEGGKGPTFHRVRPDMVVAAPDGRMYVLDALNFRVVAFDAEGRIHWTAGRRGGGPGELESPNSLTLEGGEVVAVHDPRKRSLVRYAAADGAVLEETQFALGMFRAWMAHVRALPEGHAMLRRAPFDGSDNRAVQLLRASGADTLEHFSRVLPLSSTAQYPSCGMTLTLPIPFAATVHWATHGDTVVTATDAAYIIDVFDGSGHARSIRRDVAPVPVARAEALAAMGDTGEPGPLAPCGMTPAARLEAHGYARVRQTVKGLIFDREGRLWVQRDSVGGAIDVFDPTGAYMGSLPPGTPLPVVFLPDGRVGYPERDELDVERMVVARLRER